MKWCLQNPKLCGFYKFQKEYLDELIDKKIVIINFKEVEELEEGSEGSEYANHEEKDLEKKMENLMWKMNCFIVVVAIVVFGIVVRCKVEMATRGGVNSHF